MASFSSRGPDGDWIKPDVTAPGVQVLAGTTPQPDQTTADNGPPGNLYMAIAGTSMASPHSAGVSALVKASHPTWTPEEIKSALMTSSVQAVTKEDGVTPADPFDMGAGRIEAARAVNPTLVFNETYSDFIAAGTDVIDRVDLNIPSIDATTFSGDLTTQRTAINVPQTFPNAARPNNVIAPFWTDLNTMGGTPPPSPGTPGSNVILVNTLSGGGQAWIVVDFESVKNFSNSTTHTGEIWIRYTGGEQLTVSYGTANAAAGDPGSAMNWGTENRDGTSGINLSSAPADNSEYRPVLSGPVPGGQVTLPFDVFSKKVGMRPSVASMTTNQTKGTTIVTENLNITP
jgi:subtilisin family serine protease